MTSRARPTITSTLAILALIAATSAGAVAATLLTPDKPPADLRPGSALTSAPVQQQQFDDQRTVPVALSVTDATPLTANGDGRVTALRTSAGQELTSGSSPLDLNGVPIIALHTSVPMFRDLGIDSTGADVKALQTELARLGYDVDSTGYYGWATRNAMKDLQSKAGATHPDGSLPLAQVLWLPARTVIPGTWTALLGSTATAGSSYGTVPGRLIAVTATLPGMLAPGARTLRLWGQEAPLGEDRRAVEADFLAAVMKTPEYAATVGADDPGSLTGTVALAKPVQTLKVPPTALFGIDGTTACVQSGDTVLPVTVVGSALGASLVTLDEAPSSAPDEAAETPDDKASDEKQEDTKPAVTPPTEVNIGKAITAKECR